MKSIGDLELVLRLVGKKKRTTVSRSPLYSYGSRDSVELAKRARQKTTRYAGARQMLYKDNHLSDTM